MMKECRRKSLATGNGPYLKYLLYKMIENDSENFI